MIPNDFSRLPPHVIDKLSFVADHYPDLVEMYTTIMEHLKVPGGEGGESLWEEDRSISFIPYYIDLVDSQGNAYNEEVCRTFYWRVDSYSDAPSPLYKVSGSRFAIPLCYDVNYTNVNDLFLYHPPMYLPNDNSNSYYAFINLPLNDSSYKGNVFLVQVNDYAQFSLLNVTEDKTPFTFNSIKPKDNKGIYLQGGK